MKSPGPEYTPGLWWCTWLVFWSDVGRAEQLTAKIEATKSELAKIRRQYLKRGRKSHGAL